jgi:hypothetical protein
MLAYRSIDPLPNNTFFLSSFIFPTWFFKKKISSATCYDVNTKIFVMGALREEKKLASQQFIENGLRKKNLEGVANTS